jgi:hypothetical protein
MADDDDGDEERMTEGRRLDRLANTILAVLAVVSLVAGAGFISLFMHWLDDP